MPQLYVNSIIMNLLPVDIWR